jgi:hypothetical protein
MNELIEKWKPMMQYTFTDGKSVPEDKYQECAESLENLEKRYKGELPNNEEQFIRVLTFCVSCFANGEKLISTSDFLRDHPEIKEKLDNFV